MMTVRYGVALLLLAVAGFAAAADQPKPPSYFDEDVAASNPLRVEQAQELDAYVVALKRDKARLNALFQPDYSSPQAYEKSVEPLRRAFCQSIGYPPPGDVPHDEATFRANRRRQHRDLLPRQDTAILPEIHAEGLYIVPKGLKGRAPLVISMHGGGGSPEVALFHGGANYHDMVRGGVKRGYVVFAPQHLFVAQGYRKDIRNRTDERLRLVGTSLTAVEIAKITRGLDVLLKRPEVDPARVAMVGLSYGGYYALVTPAIDTRIKVAVSSCYYGVQEGRYERDELSVPSDFKFPDRFTLFRDSDIVAMICPRAAGNSSGRVRTMPIIASRAKVLPRAVGIVLREAGNSRSVSPFGV